jgi:hypothetical protein
MYTLKGTMIDKNLRRGIWLAAFAVVPSLAFAQGEAPADSAAGLADGPPIQKITTASAVSTERLGSILGVRELADGRVLVNDGARRRLVLMDTTLAPVEVVLDSLTQFANSYGTRPGMLLPYRADSTLFVDPASLAMLLLDPAGKIVRVRSVWRVEDVNRMTGRGGAQEWPGVDAKGRIVFRMPVQGPRINMRRGANGMELPDLPPEPDSAFVVAVDLDTRIADTLGVIRIPKTGTRIRRSAEGRPSFDRMINPLPATDEWAVLADGTVAFVRGRDYRVEYLNPDGTQSSSPKLPFAWERMTDDDKTAMVDSIKAARMTSAMTEYVTSMIRWSNLYGKPFPEWLTAPAGYRPPPGLPRDWTLPAGASFPEGYVFACAPGVDPEAPGANCSPAPARPGGDAPPAPVMQQAYVIAAEELPDYKPPIAPGSVRADADGNLWIQTIPSQSIPGGDVYDIVSRQGELVNRIQLPPGYALVGFGKGKVVYLSMRDTSGIHLARVRLR